MRKKARQKEVRLRKNSFPTLIVMLLLWLGVAGVIYLVEPDAAFAIAFFFLLIFLSLLFTFATILANTRRGFIASIALTLFLFLRYLGIGHILNFLLIAGAGLSIELYFTKKLD